MIRRNPTGNMRVAAITRRHFAQLLAAGGTAAMLGDLTACSNGTAEEGVSQGFASDTEVRSEPVTLYIVADANLKRALPSSSTSRIEDYFSRYQEQAGREQVTFAVKYKTTAQIAKMAAEGFNEGTAVIGAESAISDACDTGTLDGGAAKTSMRTFTSQLFETIVVLRKEDGTAEMPKSDTLSGEDSEDGQISRMQKLAQVTGKIAIGSEDLIEGMLANRLLARWGYYSDESGQGGSYSKEIASKMLVCKSADEMVSSLKKDKAQLAFGVQSMLWGEFDGIEQVYQPAYGTMVYAGATLPNADCAGVARDFMEFITRCV